MKHCNSIIFVLLTCFFGFASIAQNGPVTQALENVSDTLIKMEISSFSKMKVNSEEALRSLKSPLIEIPLQHCSDSEVHLSLSKFNSSISTFIHLYFKGKTPDRSLDSIFVVTHSHFWVKIPRSAFDGINQNLSCESSVSGGKRSHLISPNYKAFYSANKRRMYIYMIGGSEGDRYEVTWVFVGDKYLTRVLNKIQ